MYRAARIAAALSGVGLALAVLPTQLEAQRTERLYQQACYGGDLIACNVFGLMYEAGDGVPRDPTRASELYSFACEGGELVGCTNLGLLYAVGLGVEQDRARARGLFLVACEAGEMLGCTGLENLESPTVRAVAGSFFKAGRVGEADTERPLARVIVTLPELDRSFVSDGAGRFRMTGLPRGRYRIVAERAGYELLEGELDVPGARDVVLLLTRDDGVDLDAPGRVVGRVTGDDAAAGLADVHVTTIGEVPVGALSDARGRFELRDLPAGYTEVRFVRIGYAPRTATLVVHPGRTVELSATMSSAPIELEAIEVTVRSAYLERNGFYERLDRSSGTQFTRARLDVIDPIDVSDLVRRVPGVALRRFTELDANRLFAVSRRGMTPGGGPCVLPVWIDGVRSPDPDLNQILPNDIEAIEFYSGISAPAQYGPAGCGVVLVWTVRGSGGG